MGSMHERLRQARIEAGYSSARSAAIAHGWGVSTYTAHENGQNDYNHETAEIYAKAFKTKPEWLLLGKSTVAAPEIGIDAQLRKLDPRDSKILIDRFNAMIEAARMLRTDK